MARKNKKIPLKYILIMGQIGVLFCMMTVFFFMTVFNHREKRLHSLMSKLNTTVENMASQLRANQVPLGNPYDKGVFIVNQKDGSMVVERQGDEAVDAELWRQYQSKFIYEMQKQKYGWIVYPEKAPFDLNRKQKIVRYFSIDELGWILAVEISRPTDMELLEDVVTPSMFMSLFLIFLCASVSMGFMTWHYIKVITKRISDEVEHGFMSMSGDPIQITENKTNFKPPLTEVDIPNIPTGTSAVSQQEPAVKIDEREAFLEKKPKQIKPESNEENSQKPEIKKEEPPIPKQKEASGSMTININNIKSDALRKMIQDFREK